jgi:hypothetical protein
VKTHLLVSISLAGGAVLGLAAWAQQNLGYTDTPFLPGGKWRVHDGTRPQPRIVDPGTASTQDAPGRPPADAVVLFDGKDLSKWRDEKGNPTGWKLENGAMVVPPAGTPNGGTIYSRDEFGDCQLHVEWSAPTQVKGDSQGRGNSGVFLFGRYEIQVLDSYNNKTYPDGQASAIYGQYPPLVNASRKPGEWQAYDILFTAPRFKDGQLVKPAFATVLHNGVAVHNHVELLGPMSHRQLPKYTPHGEKGPISFQDHGNPVRFRSVWVRELKGYDEG